MRKKTVTIKKMFPIYERETRETRAVIRKTRDARANKHKLAQKYSKYSQKPNDSSECDSHKSY